MEDLATRGIAQLLSMHGGGPWPRTNGKAPVKGAVVGLFGLLVMMVWHIWQQQQPGGCLCGV